MEAPTLKIFVCDEVKVTEGAPAREISSGEYVMTPSPFFASEDFVVSPDSTWAPTLARAPSFGTVNGYPVAAF